MVHPDQDGQDGHQAWVLSQRAISREVAAHTLSAHGAFSWASNRGTFERVIEGESQTGNEWTCLLHCEEGFESPICCECSCWSLRSEFKAAIASTHRHMKILRNFARQ